MRSIATAIAILLSLAGVSGCASEVPDAPGPATTPLTCDSGESYYYLINRVDVPQADAAGLLEGFDLDGVASADGDAAGCGHADFTSPDGESGIDNQLAVLANELKSQYDISGSMATAIEEGTFAIVAEVRNVDDLASDDCVNVTLGLGYLPGDGAPELGADGRPAPGQTYDLRPLAEVRGRIAGGRLSTDPVRFESAITIVEPAVPFVIDGARLQADISATRLDNGVVGGAASVSMLQDAVAAMKPEMADLAALVLESQADLEPSGPGCGALSAGFVFAGVEAERGADR